MSSKTKQLVYATLTFDLGVAHTDTEYVLPGIFDTIVVMSLSPTASASIRLNEKTRDSLDLTAIRVINAVAIDRIFLTNTLQAGLTLVLAFGADSSFGVSLLFNTGVFIRDPLTPANQVQVTLNTDTFQQGVPAFLSVMSQQYVYNPATFYGERVRTPTVWKSALILNAGSTPIWTSGVGKKWRLMGIRITLVNGTTAAAASLLKVLDVAADTGIGVQICGAAMGAVATSSIIVNENYGNGVLAAATNTALNINLSSVLGVAGVFVQVWGTEE